MDTLTKTNKLLLDSLELVNKDKPDTAFQNIQVLLQENDLSKKDYELAATILMLCGDFDQAVLMFNKAANYAGAAFSIIMKGDIDKAKDILNNASNSSFVEWCKFLLDLFSGKLFLKKCPTFLQIRHYLEITVYYLLIAGNKSFVDILKNELNNLILINIDAEKFVGCAYFHFGDLKEAIKYLNQSIQRNCYDGETYFVLANVYEKQKDYYLAASMLESAALLLPEHSPTQLLREQIRKKLETMNST